jgi:hypothetical protein
MTGGLVLAANTTTVIPLQFTSAASDPTAPANGSMWLISDALKFRASSGTKTVAFTDSNITGTASAWTTGRTIQVTGDVTGTSPSITGATDVTEWSLTTNPATNVKSVTGTANRITATKNNTTGDVTLTLPQDIHTSATPTFGSVTANGVQVGSAANTISVATSNANLTLAGNGTGNVTISTPASLSGILTVTGTTTLNGNVTLGSTANLTLSNSAASITLASSGTSINNASAAVSGVAAIGDMYLRVPVSTGKAFVIKGTGNPAATDQIVTQGTLDSFVANTGNIANDAVTFDKLLNSTATTGIIGSSTTSGGNYEHISTATSGHVLVRGASSLGFGTLLSTSFADNTIALSRLNQQAGETLLGVSGTSTANVGAISKATAKTMLGVSALEPTSTIVTAAITAANQTVDVALTSFTINKPTILKITTPSASTLVRASKVRITGTGTFLLVTGTLYGVYSSTSSLWGYNSTASDIERWSVHSVADAAVLQTAGIAGGILSTGPTICTVSTAFTLATIVDTGSSFSSSTRYGEFLIIRLT